VTSGLSQFSIFLSTTHLVAAKLGTNKVRMAQKVKGIKIVNPNWL
jgi:hypothetical protein